MIERQPLARPSQATPRGRRLGGRAGSAVRITAHFWVADRLYEVDYDRAARSDGRTRLMTVHGSERRCQCPGRDDAEQGRRERGMWSAAGSWAGDAAGRSSIASHEILFDKLLAGPMGSWRR